MREEFCLHVWKQSGESYINTDGFKRVECECTLCGEVRDLYYGILRQELERRVSL